jgi:hypothetical protein
MNYQPPQAVELTDDESKLNEQIPDSPGPSGNWTQIANAMESLLKSLIKRKAIPEIRLRVFTDPKYAETRNKSPKQIFESKGVCAKEIYRHPHFIKHLRYFINGPDLPQTVISGFCKILNDDAGTSGEILDQRHRFVRSCVRKYKLDRHSAASNFFKLAIELGIDHDAYGIRTAAMSTR